MSLANFYDNPTSQHTDVPPPKPAEPPQQTQQSSADVTHEQREATARAVADDPAKVLFGDTLYREAESALLPDSTLDATPEQLTAARADYRAELHKVALPVAMARSLTEQYLVGMRNPISDEQHAVARTTMHAELVQQFGREGAAEKLADVRALLAKSQHITDALVDSGMDVKTRVIIELAEHARSLRGRGKL